MNKYQHKDTAIVLLTKQNQGKRTQYGLGRLEKELDKIGMSISREAVPEDTGAYAEIEGMKIYAAQAEDPAVRYLEEEEYLVYHSGKPEGEGFYLQTCPGGLVAVIGGNDTGVLYGLLYLAERTAKEGRIPHNLAYGDAPVLKLRGPAVGLQKTKLEPPRLTYEYPITPDRFPWFYDKKLWEDFLDMLLEERCNVLYLWTGHPFSSLVKLEEYPEALEVTEEEFRMNRDVFGWLTEQCDKRGIWVVLKFYSIHIPLPFARAHGLELLQSSIHPLVADYTRKSISKFIQSFPHIGLMVCLGEALRGTRNKTDWFIQTVIPGVKDGIREAGITEEPPLILRGHDCDPVMAMEEARGLYNHLYTMWKYNGESLTTCRPRGNWQKRHQDLSVLGGTHIINVHVLANLEPFRYMAPSYIQKCIQALRYRLGGNGLHLYPLFFWDWPYSPDKTPERLLQIDRDFMWYKAWFRYSWNPEREESSEELYWEKLLAEHFSISQQAAKLLLRAGECAGRCTPRLLGRIGITEGNRQTLSLGMTMSQLTNVTRYRPNKELWESVADRGETLDEYVRKELSGTRHTGETPTEMMGTVLQDCDEAVSSMEALSPEMAENQELSRIGSDVKAVALLCHVMAEKLEAALLILRYRYTMEETCLGDTSLLNGAQVHMEKALVLYRELAALTDKTYLYANSMQTPQRKIPFPNGETYGHWTQCLPEYEAEYESFCAHVKELEAGIYPAGKETVEDIRPLKPISYTLLGDDCETFSVQKGEKIFTDCDWTIGDTAPELAQLTGVRMGLGKAIDGGVKIRLRLEEDAKILVGYMASGGVEWLQVPDLETNTHADDRGGLAIVYESAIRAQGCPPVNIHAYSYEKGEHELYFGTGGFLIAGAVAAEEPIKPRNAGLSGESYETLDWMYEE